MVEKNVSVEQQTVDTVNTIKNFGTKETPVNGKSNAEDKGDIPEDIDQFYEKLAGDEDEDAEAIKNLEVLTFEIRQECIEIVQKRCIELEYPLLAEYDFRNDTFNPSLKIDLKPATTLR